MNTDAICKLVAYRLSDVERAALWKAADVDPLFSRKMIHAIIARNRDDSIAPSYSGILDKLTEEDRGFLFAELHRKGSHGFSADLFDILTDYERKPATATQSSLPADIASMLAGLRWYTIKLGNDSVMILASSAEQARDMLMDALNLGDGLRGQP